MCFWVAAESDVDDTTRVQFIELGFGNPNILAANHNFSNSLEISSMALAAEPSCITVG